jgi:hypothetical protein
MRHQNATMRRTRLQWRFLWLMHAKFICGITGVVRTDDGQARRARAATPAFARPWSDVRFSPAMSRYT